MEPILPNGCRPSVAFLAGVAAPVEPHVGRGQFCDAMHLLLARRLTQQVLRGAWEMVRGAREMVRGAHALGMARA